MKWQSNGLSETIYTTGDDNCREGDHVDTANMSKVRYSIRNGSYKAFIRIKPKITRYVNYSKKVDSESYYLEQIILFHP